jgi:hypothetical protein
MKKYIGLIALSLFLAFTFSSCIDDDDSPVKKNDPIPSVDISENLGNSIVEGLVTDQNGEPLSGVTVFFGSEATTTSGDGKYKLEKVEQSKNGKSKRIWFEKDGFVSTQKLVKTKDFKRHRADASLRPVKVTKSISASVGGKIEDGKSFTVKFSSNKFKDETGAAVTGDVTVEATPYEVDSEDFLEAFPGDFSGVRTDGTTQAIESFGFINIELSSGGKKVDMIEGSAEIKFKAPANAPSVIPMWYYDFDKAEWIEEGEATLVNGYFVGSVTHFTPWNFDKPTQNSVITGLVTNQDAEPLANAYVEQRGLDNTSFSSAYTDINGRFELLAQAGGQTEIFASYEFYKGVDFLSVTASESGGTINAGTIVIEISEDTEFSPILESNLVKLSPGAIVKLNGNYFGNTMQSDYKVEIDGNTSTEIIIWSNKQIIFVTPDNIKDEGTIRIIRGDKSTASIPYIRDNISWDVIDIPYDDYYYNNFLTDENSNLWVAESSNLMKYNGSSWANIPIGNFVNDSSAQVYFLIPHLIDGGDIWLSDLERNSLIKYSPDGNYIWDMNDNIYDIAKSDNGIWILSYNKLIHFDGTDFVDYPFVNNTIKSKNDKLSDDQYQLSKLLVDQNDNVWMHNIYSQEILEFDGTNFRSHILASQIFDVALNNNDELIVLTAESLFKIEDENVVKYIDFADSPMPVSIFSSVEISTDGKIWLASGFGNQIINETNTTQPVVLASYDGANWDWWMAQASSVPMAAINNIQQGADGSIYISDNQKIARMIEN